MRAEAWRRLQSQCQAGFRGVGSQSASQVRVRTHPRRSSDGSLERFPRAGPRWVSALQSGNEAAAGSPVTEAAAIESIAPFERREAHVLARDEYERLDAQLRSLDRPDWDCLTDCPPWS